MLEPQSMLVLHDALEPPEGHELHDLIITTFTLDLVSLLSVPLAFTWFGGRGDADAIERDPLELLTAVQRQSGKITVFHQAGAIGVPDRHRRLLTLVEDALVPVPEPREGAIFHPKIWLATYRDGADNRRYRLLCLSRNLTADRSWDTILSLEGVATRTSQPQCKPLSDFLVWLARTPRLAPERALGIKALARRLATVRFVPPRPFEHLAFRPLGIPGYRKDPIAAVRRVRMLVVSPFIGEQQIGKLCAGAEEAVLVTRPEELAKLTVDLPPNIKRVLRLDDALEAEPDDTVASAPWLAGLHAKTYVADQGWDATVWTGSPNATSAGFGRNVEFLVELTGKRSACGIDKILGDGSPNTFSSMLVPCGDLEADPVDDTIERRLAVLAREIAELPVQVAVTEDGTTWRLELTLQGKRESAATAIVSAAPLPSDTGMQPIDFSHPVLARFHGLAAHEVSGLFAVEIRLVAHPEVSRSFVASWPLLGAVPDRVRALLIELASDPSRVLAFIRMFLGGGDMPPPPVNGTAPGVGVDPMVPALSSAGAPDDALLELLIQALAREPKRLDELARWLPDLAGAMGDDAEHDLLGIWEPVWEARQELV